MPKRFFISGVWSHEREIIQAHWGNRSKPDNRLTYLDSNITRLLRIGNSSVLTELKTKQKNVYIGLAERIPESPSFGQIPYTQGYQPAKQIQRLREQNAAPKIF